MGLYIGSQAITPTIPAPPSDITLVNLEVDENGTYTAPNGYGYKIVDVDIEPQVTLQTKSVNPTESAQTVTFDNGYDGLSTVTVGAISSTYVGSGIARRSSSNLTVSGSTITVPSGYYASQGTKSVASGSVTAPTSISGTAATVSTGTNTITLSKSVSVTPRVTTAGYVSSGTAGNAFVSLTANVTTKAAATITPTTSNQTIASGTYLTGTQTIAGDSNLKADNIKKDVSIFGITGTHEGITEVEDAVRFYDYDGTILYSYSAEEFLALSAMPANPSHTGLVAQGWNWTLSDAKSFVTNWECLDIGQMYTTSSGATEIDITLYQGRLAPYLGLAVNGTVSIDWGDNSTPDTVTGTSLTSQKRTQHIYASPGNYTIKISITSGSWSFYGTSTYFLLGDNSSSTTSYVYSTAINAIRIGSGNITIGAYAFAYCRRMRYVTIPNTIVNISGSRVFNNCNSLEFITVPWTTSGLSFNSTYYCESCYRLKCISFPNNFGVLGALAFGNNYSLESFILPESITSLNGWSLENSYLRLERLIIPAQNLKRINKKNYSIDWAVDTETGLKDYLFYYNYELKTVTIPNTITRIGGNTFSYCLSLVELTLPSTGATFQNQGQITTCRALRTINNIDKLTSLTTSFVSSCSALTGPITLNSSITTLPSNCFYNCYTLNSINLPSSLTTINSTALSSLYCLKEIILPNSLTTIDSSAFLYDSGLSSITIPSSVTTIGNSAFGYCYGLGEIHVKPTTPPTLGGSSVFSNLPTNCIIYVPSASLSAYQSASNWSAYASQMVGE